MRHEEGPGGGAEATVGLYHILSREEWAVAEAAGVHAPPSLGAEGFVHLSTRSQLLRTAERYFGGRSDLVVLSVREDRLQAPLRYEEAHGEPFPHLYGPLDLRAVEGIAPLRLEGGRFVFPDRWTRRA
jgi:uncharacterized protein (DUF952 family)